MRLGEYSASIHTLNEKISLDIENGQMQSLHEKITMLERNDGNSRSFDDQLSLLQKENETLSGL